MLKVEADLRGGGYLRWRFMENKHYSTKLLAVSDGRGSIRESRINTWKPSHLYF